MSVKNFYPEKPLVPYKKTSVPMSEVIAYLQSLPIEKELKKAAYIFFRFESRNGESGVNNNYAGVQADSGRWQSQYDKDIIGIVKKVENGTGNERYFVAFASFKTSVDFLVGRLKARGLYVGGTTHKIVNMTINTANDFARAYEKEWVKGLASAEPSKEKLANVLSMYKQATQHFK